MLQISGLTITYRKDLRIIIDKSIGIRGWGQAVIIGEEGNGKSTLLNWIYNLKLAEEYVDCVGERILGKEKLCYLPQELPTAERNGHIRIFL